MFNRDWRNGLALGLTIGGGVVLIAFLFGQQIYDLSKCYHTAQCERSAAKYEGKDFPSSWWWDWTGSLVTSDDTLAQWIMSFFTVAAVLLVWRTLVATQEMARDTARAVSITKEMAERQIRAYISVENSVAKNLEVDGVLRVDFNLKNSGQSPAKKLSARAVVGIVAGDANDFKLSFRGIQRGSVAQISAGGIYEQYRIYSAPISEGTLRQIHDGRLGILFAGLVEYTDVFGVRRRTVFRSTVRATSIENSRAIMVMCRRNNSSS